VRGHHGGGPAAWRSGDEEERGTQCEADAGEAQHSEEDEEVGW